MVTVLYTLLWCFLSISSCVFSDLTTEAPTTSMPPIDNENDSEQGQINVMGLFYVLSWDIVRAEMKLDTCRASLEAASPMNEGDSPEVSSPDLDDLTPTNTQQSNTPSELSIYVPELPIQLPEMPQSVDETLQKDLSLSQTTDNSNQETQVISPQHLELSAPEASSLEANTVGANLHQGTFDGNDPTKIYGVSADPVELPGIPLPVSNGIDQLPKPSVTILTPETETLDLTRVQRHMGFGVEFMLRMMISRLVRIEENVENCSKSLVEMISEMTTADVLDVPDITITHTTPTMFTESNYTTTSTTHVAPTTPVMRFS